MGKDKEKVKGKTLSSQQTNKRTVPRHAGLPSSFSKGSTKRSHVAHHDDKVLKEEPANESFDEIVKNPEFVFEENEETTSLAFSRNEASPFPSPFASVAKSKVIDDIIERKRRELSDTLKDNAIMKNHGKSAKDQSDDGSEDSDIEHGIEKGSKEEDEGKEEEEGSDVDTKQDDETKKKYFADHTMDEESLLNIASFNELNLSRPIQKALGKLGYTKPTRIQSVAIPVALSGKDLCGGATTGSGKTAAFIVPILERLLYRTRHAAAIRVLILLPTRELAVQCTEVIKQLSEFTDIQCCLLAGGLSYKAQELDLKKRPDVLVATPGRLIDHIKNSPSFALDTIEILVLDEADRMLEVGFEEELQEIVKSCPLDRQTMLFSATMTDNISDLIKLSLNKPVRLFVDSSEAIASNLVQEFIRVRASRESDRAAMLLALCKHYYKSKCIVFFQRRIEAHRMKIAFGLLELSAAELHGSLNQTQRLEALQKFKTGQVDFLLATDLAARGLDISGVQTVINYTLPLEYKQYLHRVGRTARAGKSGKSVSLVGEGDRKILKLAIKNSRDKVKQRIIKPDLIVDYKRSIDELQDTINDIIREEREETIINEAERDVNKAKNLLEHHDEIYSRPKKTFIKKKAKNSH